MRRTLAARGASSDRSEPISRVPVFGVAHHAADLLHDGRHGGNGNVALEQLAKGEVVGHLRWMGGGPMSEWGQGQVPGLGVSIGWRLAPSKGGPDKVRVGASGGKDVLAWGSHGPVWDRGIGIPIGLQECPFGWRKAWNLRRCISPRAFVLSPLSPWFPCVGSF